MKPLEEGWLEGSPGKTLAMGAGCVALVQVSLGATILLITGKLDEAGQFGDLFGAVNALFSGLAFSGLIYTALLQRRELALQRAELAANRKELSRTAVAQEASERALVAQVQASNQATEIARISALIEYYDGKMKLLKERPSRMAANPGSYSALNDRKERLERRLEDIYEALVVS